MKKHISEMKETLGELNSNTDSILKRNLGANRNSRKITFAQTNLQKIRDQIGKTKVRFSDLW